MNNFYEEISKENFAWNWIMRMGNTGKCNWLVDGIE
jgi:hypothetical protein